MDMQAQQSAPPLGFDKAVHSVQHSLASSLTAYITICNSQLPYTWNSKQYNTAGTYKLQGKNHSR